MAEKKFGWGTVLLASGAAALVAGGVVAYLKREELKKFAEDVMSRVKPGDEGIGEELFDVEPDNEIKFERDIVFTDTEDEDDDEPADVEIEITVAREGDVKAAEEE